MLAETATTDLSREKNPSGFAENAQVAQEGGKVAKVAREQLESQLGHSVISPLSAKKVLQIDKNQKKEEKKEGR